jgi:hypothetical protein
MQCDHIINGRATESAYGPYKDCWCIEDNCTVEFIFEFNKENNIVIRGVNNGEPIYKIVTDIPYSDVFRVMDRLAYIPFSNWENILKSYNKNKEMANETLDSDEQL